MALLNILKLLYLLFIRWNVWYLSRNNLLNLITHHLLNALQLEKASFYYCRKWSAILFVMKNWYSIFIETTNISVKSVLRHRTFIHFTETSSNVVFRATARLCRVKICPRIARIFVLLSAHVKKAVYQGMGMWTRGVCKWVVILSLESQSCN